MHPTTKPSPTTEKQVKVLRAHALTYPETHEDFPWGHSAFKVRGKAFAFLHADAEGFSMSVKLPDSNSLALQLPFAEPTGYGLGKSGWVSARFGKQERAPLTMLEAWLEESYTAVAPKALVKQLLGVGSAPPGAAKSKPKPKPASPTAERPPKSGFAATGGAGRGRTPRKADPTARKKADPSTRKKAGAAARKKARPAARKKASKRSA